MTKRTGTKPLWSRIRLALEVTGCIALALALFEADRQRRTIHRLIDMEIERGDTLRLKGSYE
jgi:hypothetical protein